MDYECIRVTGDGPVQRLTLNRPEVRNAFNARLIAEIRDWAQRTAVLRDVRVVVLAGSGKAFCAGADLEWMAAGLELSYDQIVQEVRSLHDMLTALDRLPQVLVGRVQGGAIAGGAGLVSVCDAAIAADDALFGFTEVKLGIIPAIVSPFVIAKIGPSYARELFVTGMKIPAARAREIGLVHQVVSADRLDAAVDAYVEDILTAPAADVGAIKAHARAVDAAAFEQVFAMTADALARRRMSPDAKGAIRAFLSGRRSRPAVER